MSRSRGDLEQVIVAVLDDALDFYLRRGVRELARRLVVPHRSLHYASGDALLLAGDTGPTP